MNLAEPSQYTESAPDLPRISISLSPISLIATSQEMRVHLPSTSLIGYLRRRSPCTSSRVAAPLAQCEPRLIGESQPGSWPTQTPFCTSPITVQPTEQCVQMFLRMVIATPGCGPAAAASALRTLASGKAPTAARPPTARPERRRKLRRSRAPPD